MTHGVADQLVLLVLDSAAADGMDDIGRAADRRACTANYSRGYRLAARQWWYNSARPMYFCRASGLYGASMP
jgi:hypothetical protein